MSPARHLLTLPRRGYDLARFVATHAALRLGVFAALALAAAWPLLATGTWLNQFRDAHVLGHYESAAREAILHWHQAPLWDPYYCGGMYLLGTPQARFVSPTFLFTLVFGETRGEALTAFAMMIVGLEGTYQYARDRRATRFGALLAAPIFALGGIFAVSPSLGWIGFFGFELLPWMALGVRRALASERWAVVLVAVAGAWCIGFGGTYAAPLAAVWCAFEVVEFLLRRKVWRQGLWKRGLVVVGAGALLALGLAAVRAWPIVETMAASPRIIGGAPGNDFNVLAKMFFFPIHADTDDGEFYVGFFVLPAVLFALARKGRRALFVPSILYVWLAAGYKMKPSLFAALRELPVYTALRYPERFLILLGLAMAVLTALGISTLEAYVRTPRARKTGRRGKLLPVYTLVALAVVTDVGPLVAQHTLHAADRSLAAPPMAPADAGPFHQARGSRWALEYYEPHARGSLSCWEAYPVPESPLLQGDLKTEEWLVDPSAGTITEQAWSPDRIDLAVSLTRPTRVEINKNWDAGWRAGVGQVRSDHGLLAVDVPEGAHTVSLRFEPRSARGGLLASLVAAAALVLIGRRARRMRIVKSPREALVLVALAVAPIVPVAIVVLLNPVPAFALPPMTPDGRDVVADSLDEAAVRIDAKWDDGVVLEAATLSNSDPIAGKDVTLEIDWKRGKELDPGLGIFMHIEPSSGKTMNGDHVLLSGVLDLEYAPPDKTLRDVIPLYVPEDARGKTWKIWVGLWHVRGEGSRVHVVDGGHTAVDGDRVLAVAFTPR